MIFYYIGTEAVYEKFYEFAYRENNKFINYLNSNFEQQFINDDFLNVYIDYSLSINSFNKYLHCNQNILFVLISKDITIIKSFLVNVNRLNCCVVLKKSSSIYDFLNQKNYKNNRFDKYFNLLISEKYMDLKPSDFFLIDNTNSFFFNFIGFLELLFYSINLFRKFSDYISFKNNYRYSKFHAYYAYKVGLKFNFINLDFILLQYKLIEKNML